MNKSDIKTTLEILKTQPTYRLLAYSIFLYSLSQFVSSIASILPW